jgi:enamine deaminase RidA (YjgF/YER057c/UK114 family)
VTRAGPHVWVAGIVGQAQDGSIAADVVDQFDIAITIMDKCLKVAGAGAEHVVKVQVRPLQVVRSYFPWSSRRSTGYVKESDSLCARAVEHLNCLGCRLQHDLAALSFEIGFSFRR